MGRHPVGTLNCRGLSRSPGVEGGGGHRNSYMIYIICFRALINQILTYTEFAASVSKAPTNTTAIGSFCNFSHQGDVCTISHVSNTVTNRFSSSSLLTVTSQFLSEPSSI